MAILTFRNVILTLGQPPLFDGVNFSIERGERLCLVGRNGTGKSTLLRMIMGDMPPDDGEVVRIQGLRTAQLEQEVPQDTHGSVYHVVAGGLGNIGAVIERYHNLTHALADGDYSKMDDLERCQQELEAADGWTVGQRVDNVLTRLALEPDSEVDSLSGGLKRRVMLARALVSEPDLLLLDEPTNHLDIASIMWLEEFLLDWNGTLLFITHDRAFLQRLATRIIELDRGKLTDFPGDYATYMARKEALLAAEDTANALFDKKLAQEEVWVRQGVKARRTRNEGRVRALKKLREEFAARRVRTGSARMTIQESDRSGKVVVEAIDVAFEYSGKPVIRDLNTVIMRGDKVGIIGPNGAGKTTLLRLLLGQLAPTRGILKTGTNLEVAYFDQYRAALDEDKTVQENIGQGSESVTINGQPRHVLSYLQDFLFTPNRARQPVRALSGGERNRLLLARLFTRPSNLLVLDEPTNDLDSDTLDLLEELIIDYAGTVLLVSHDRAFINNVVTSSLVFEGNGIVNEYVGGYDDWLRQRTMPAETKTSAKPKLEMAEPVREKTAKKLSHKDQRELDSLPANIEKLEEQRSELSTLMSASEFYQQEKTVISKAQRRLAQIEGELKTAYARWEELEALRDPEG